MFVTQRERTNPVTTTMFRLTGELHLLYGANTGLLLDGVPSFLIRIVAGKSEEADRWQPELS